jgi:hypothetical protein
MRSSWADLRVSFSIVIALTASASQNCLLIVKSVP